MPDPSWLRTSLWSVAGGYALWLMYQSHQSDPAIVPPESWGTWGDKWGHALAYAILAMLVFTVLRSVKSAWPPSSVLRFGWLLVALFAATDEWHQYWIPGRNMDLFDWCADVTGASLALILCFITGRSYSQKKGAAEADMCSQNKVLA